jgi:hypothetical protein
MIGSPNLGASGRARMSATLQRSVGNARIARMVQPELHSEGSAGGAAHRIAEDHERKLRPDSASAGNVATPVNRQADQGSTSAPIPPQARKNPKTQHSGTPAKPQENKSNATRPGSAKPLRDTAVDHQSAGKKRAGRASRESGKPARRRRTGLRPGDSGAVSAASAPTMPEFIAPIADWQKSEVVIPYIRSEGSRVVGDAIGHTAQDVRRGLRESVHHGINEVRRETAQQRGFVSNAGARQSRQIQGEFATSCARVEHTITIAQANLEAQAEEQQAALAEWHAGAITQAGSTFMDGAQRVSTMGNSYGARAIQAADDSANQAAGSLEAQIAEARRIGESRSAGSSDFEIAEAKAKAARDLAAETEEKVQDAVEKFLPDLRANGSDVAESYRGEAVNAVLQINLALPQVLSQISLIQEQTAPALTQAAHQATHMLFTTEAEIGASLAASEHKALSQMHGQVSRKVHELTMIGQHAAASLDGAGRKAAKAGDDRLSSLSRQLTGSDLDAKQAPSVAGSVTASIANSYHPLCDDVDRTSVEIRDQIADSGGSTVAAINTTGPAVAHRLSGMLAQTRDIVDTQTNSVSTQIINAVQQTTVGGNAMLKDISTELNAQFGTVDEAFGKGLSNYRQGLDKQTASALDDVREPVQTLPDRIATAQVRVEEQAHKSWLRRQWDDFVNMISDPGFWVTLLVGLVLVVLAIVFLPEELGLLAIVGIGAAIGALSTGAGTIVSNLYHGRPWHENLLRNIAIGAGAGAVIALAAVGLAALGIGTMGMIAGLSLTAGAMTIVTNLINGRPWDEGLLANMALAGVFAGIGKFFSRFAPREEPPTPRPPEPEPVQPEPPVPEPQPQPEPPRPEPISLNFPKSWNKFVADLNQAFRQRLNQFRGNNDLEPDFSGGEGRIFASEGKFTALKRWFQARLVDMPRSIGLLEDARSAIEPDPKLNNILEVVNIEEKGPDWILRDFDPNTVELKGAGGDPAAQSARARAIAELESRRQAGSINDILENVLKKLKKEPPSANLHWSAAKQKIIVIDMQ